MTPDEMLARLLYRDGLMLVIDKPAGFAVHKGPKGGESLEDHFGALRFGLPRAPALAHRLDRDTSGCLVLGRHRKALATLGKLFKGGRIGKTYWAVVEGGPTEDEGRIDLPLGRRDETRGWWMKPDPQGQPAVTTWKVLGRTVIVNAESGAVAPQGSLPPSTPGLPGFDLDHNGRNRVNPTSTAGGTGRGVTTTTEFTATPLPTPPPQGGREQTAAGGTAEGSRRTLTWLALEPLTGRTHQLRVHCAEQGWPVLGDSIYGNTPRVGGAPLHLHSREIVVPLYKNRDPVTVMAPVPLHMHETLQACGWQGEVFRLLD
jgi:tRNA pseudouridine32 synthase/23S rRNA pseudouridine746 synthase